MIRFGIKAGLVAGAAYYQWEQGVWKTSEESEKCYARLQVAATPYIKEIGWVLPVTIPDLPNNHEVSYMIKESWNSGVGNTFKFLSNIPSCTSNWIVSQDFGKIYDKLVTSANVGTEKK